MANRLYIRRFLNKRGHHAGGYILVSVEDTSKQKDPWTSISFTLADCGRQIDLDFDVEPKYLDNSLHKVDVLIDALIQFREALEAEGELAAKRAKQNTKR